jgi:Domain of unknown function (DUF4349)
MKKIMILIILLSLYVALVTYTSQTQQTILSENKHTTQGLLSYVDGSVKKQPNTLTNIDLALRSKDSKAVYDQIRGMSDNTHSVIARANINVVNNAYTGNIIIWVPDQNINAALAALNELNANVMSERSSTVDVSETQFQLNEKIKSDKNLELKYMQILKTRKSIYDIKIVTDKLNMIRSMIEASNQRLKVLMRGTGYVVLNISITPEYSYQQTQSVWSPMEIVKKEFNRLIITLQQLATILIWLAVYLIPMSILSIIVYLVCRKVRRGC